MCKELKHKVYGLVGLAGNAHAFPVDYDKSPIEIWIGTMEFMSKGELPLDTEMISLGKFAKSVCMVPKCDPWDHVIGPHLDKTGQPIRRIDDSPGLRNPKAFNIKGFAFGSIKYLGPSTSGLVEDLSKKDEWDNATRTCSKTN